MNSSTGTNVLIGILAILIIGGGAWLLLAGSASPGTTATTTTTGTTGTNPTPSTAPAAPGVSTGTLVVASNSSAVLTGRVIPNGLQTSYWYEYGSGTSLGMRSATQAIGSGYASISAPVFITGLSANASYSYRLVAQNSLGTTQGATLSFSTNSNPPPPGSAPSTHTDTASAITRTSVNLNGHLNPNGADTSYWFEYGTDASFGNTTAFQSAGSGISSVSASIAVSGLAPATKYYYRMNAQNEFGTVTGATLTFTTLGPVAPAAPTADTTSASGIGATGATLNGKVNPNGASTTYWFEYSADSLLGNILGSTTHQALAGSGTSAVGVSATVSGLARNTTYFYRLVTSNSQGTTQGDIVSFKTKAN
jgi:phosphodiesterase/alkaline phosphatase D-like protein